MSKYIEIYTYFCEKIKNKELLEGDSLPSENEIQKLFNVSRDTVKKALILLKQNGLIEKTQGKKSIVLSHKIFDFSISNVFSFKETIKLKGFSGKTEVIVFELRKADEKIKKIFNRKDDFNYFYAERVRIFDGIRASLDIEYIIEEYSRGLNKSHLEDSLYEYIENTLQYNISYTEKTIYASNVSEYDREILKLNDDEHSLLIEESKSYLKNNILFHFTIAKHRSFYKFKDIARRNPLL